MKELLKKITPLRDAVRHVKAVVHDYQLDPLKRKLFGDLAKMVPPPRRMHDGPADYESFDANGREFFEIFTKECGLSPRDRVLDVGSGIGRKCIRLTQFIAPGGSYDGIEIVKPAVEWCQSRISKRYPNFRFQHIDVYSKYYNPRGRLKASEYKFPFADDSFNFIVLGSVFTHMLKSDMSHYFQEIRRVLKPGGVVLISYLLVNDESLALLPKWTWKLTPRVDGSMVLSPEVPEHLIAHPESLVREEYARNGLQITKTAYGSWCGRDDFFSFQDLVFATKGTAIRAVS